MQYLEQAPVAGCFLCAAHASDDERANLVLGRCPDAVVLLNKYPYGHGHLMVAPRCHVAVLGELSDRGYDGLMRELRRAAGAGVADHCHWHLLPRWNGDTNFMPLIGEVKVLSEHLWATYDRLRPLFE